MSYGLQITLEIIGAVVSCVIAFIALGAAFEASGRTKIISVAAVGIVAFSGFITSIIFIMKTKNAHTYTRSEQVVDANRACKSHSGVKIEGLDFADRDSPARVLCQDGTLHLLP